MAHEPRIIVPPGAQGVIRLKDVLRQIEQFIFRIPTLRFVLIVYPVEDKSHFAATRHPKTERAEAREVLRRALEHFDRDPAAIQTTPGSGPPQ